MRAGMRMAVVAALASALAGCKGSSSSLDPSHSAGAATVPNAAAATAAPVPSKAGAMVEGATSVRPHHEESVVECPAKISETADDEAHVQAMLDEARVELREWSCSCRANRCDERGRLQPVVEARDECPRLRARTFLAKGSDWDSLRGAAPDATGETSSEAFVRKMRDEWPG